MQVILADKAGFCFGVKRAVDLVYEQIEIGMEPIYTYGPIIHNEEVVEELAKKGVSIIPEGSDLLKVPVGTVIIRSHGISQKDLEKIRAAGFHIVDATCPFVLKIHRYVEKYSKEGAYILVVGDRTHPEVLGIVGWIHGEEGKDYSIITKEQDVMCLPRMNSREICIVSQTTFNYNKFQDLVEIIKKKGYNITVLNTICNATEERQVAAAELASQVDAMIVIGGRSSSNTQKLFEICKNECEDTYYIQTKDDLDLSLLRSMNKVGITAGASTPNKIIEEVQKKCQK
jgi:4-hydroxy-3-methylbut-2-enyl diphosphate reductase